MSLIFSCLFAFIFVCIEGKPKSYAVASDALGDVFEYVDELYQEFVALENTTLVNANSRLSVLGNKILLLEDQVRFSVNAELNATSQAFLEEVSGLEAMANQYGVSISDCVGDSRAQISALPDEALTSVLQCIVTPKNELEVQMGNAAKTVNSTFYKWVDVFQTELEQCKEEVESLQAACASTLGTEISQVKSSFPNTVNQLVANVESQFPALNNEYIKCSTNQVAAVNNRAALILADVAGCANEIFFTASTTIGTSTTTTAAPPPTASLPAA